MFLTTTIQRTEWHFLWKICFRNWKINCLKSGKKKLVQQIYETLQGSCWIDFWPVSRTLLRLWNMYPSVLEGFPIHKYIITHIRVSKHLVYFHYIHVLQTNRNTKQTPFCHLEKKLAWTSEAWYDFKHEFKKYIYILI